ncbi:hypothetical protein [Paraburkholderia sp. BL25I1N1]|uniref:hypothetical protein n=1 Tax=Paraburkholderia sp. BL25I1N1 TaxID=1938804 RepID=UPI000D07D189|nr:hypothetical protein [Paraburkholderia sp. BL25I1N1]PRX96453.1 hypothetical protein B0G73_13072 [Paraburkholderia sp. BL25I1N1]
MNPLHDSESSTDFEAVLRTCAPNRLTRNDGLLKYLERITPCHSELNDILARLSALLLATASRLEPHATEMLAGTLCSSMQQLSERLLTLSNEIPNVHLHRMQEIHRSCVRVAPKIRALTLQVRIEAAEVDALRREIVSLHAKFRATCDFKFGLNAVDFYEGCSCARLCLCVSEQKAVATAES